MRWLGLGFALALAGGCDVAPDDSEPMEFRGLEAGPLVMFEGEPVAVSDLDGGFALNIDGLPTEQVVEIEGFTFGQTVSEKEPAALTIPNIKLTISMADVAPWAEWHKSFVIDGKCTDGDEKKGSLTFLGPDLQEELATINFEHVGIISLEQEAVEANKEEVARFTVELYVESMFFDVYSAN